jgi:hypothetical protein
VIDGGHQNGLIFEDDAVLGESFESRFAEAWQAVPADWDIVYVGCTATCGDRDNYCSLDWIQTGLAKASAFAVNGIKIEYNRTIGPVNRHITIPDALSGMHCYAVTASTAKVLTQTFERIPFYGHVDLLMSKQFRNTLKMYAFRDGTLVTQPLVASASTIGTGGGSPYIGNWILDKYEVNNRGIRGGWLLSETFCRFGKAEFGGWQIVMIILGVVVAAGLRSSSSIQWWLPVPAFAVLLMMDQLIFGGIKKLKTPQYIFDVSMFAAGYLGYLTLKGKRKSVIKQRSK